MNLNEIKDLMAQFDQSSLKEFSYKNGTDELVFSKNEAKLVTETSPVPQPVVSAAASTATPQTPTTAPAAEAVSESSVTESVAEGDLVESPLVGVAYLAAGPDKPNFVSVGDTVKKGQTLVIIEAMKVMNEIPAPKDGIVTEVLVENEEMVEFGKGLVRIK